MSRISSALIRLKSVLSLFELHYFPSMQHLVPLIVLICLISKINCQKLADSYRIDQSISFNLNGKQINYPLSGGYQSLYLQSLDWDSDNLIDLVILNNGFSQPLIFEQAHVKSSNFNPVDFNFDNIFLERWFQFVDFDFDGDYDVLTLDGFDVLGVEINSGSNDAPHFGEFQRLKDDEDQLIITEFGNFPVVFDYNSDTKFDLFLTTQGDGRVRYYQNTGTEISSFHLVSNSFANISVLAAGKKHGKSTFSFIETGPDHRLDILWGDQFQNYFYYLTNIGDRENPDYMISDPLYDANGTIISSAAYNAPFITDLNRDGFSDLIMLPQFSNAANFHLYISDSISGEWQLNSTQLITTIDEGLLSFLDFYDIDSDGDPDLIISTFRNAANYYHLSFYENTGINSKQFSEFEFSKTLVFPWQNLLVNAYDFQIIDLNTDNKWDIVFTDDNGNLQVAYNSGTNLNPNFSNFFSIRNGLGNFASFRIVDLNFDTKPDLITANQSGRVQLFQTTVSLFDQLISTNLLNHQFDGWINIDHLKDNSFILYHQKEKTFYQFIVNDNLSADSLQSLSLDLPDIGQSATVSVVHFQTDTTLSLAFGNQNGGLIMLTANQAEPMPEKKSEPFAIFPNPSNGTQQIQLNKKPELIRFFTLTGQHISIKTDFINGILSWTFPKQIAAGIYFLQIDSRVYKIMKIN